MFELKEKRILARSSDLSIVTCAEQFFLFLLNSRSERNALCHCFIMASIESSVDTIKNSAHNKHRRKMKRSTSNKKKTHLCQWIELNIIIALFAIIIRCTQYYPKNSIISAGDRTLFIRIIFPFAFWDNRRLSNKNPNKFVSDRPPSQQLHNQFSHFFFPVRIIDKSAYHLSI